MQFQFHHEHIQRSADVAKFVVRSEYRCSTHMTGAATQSAKKLPVTIWVGKLSRCLELITRRVHYFRTFYTVCSYKTRFCCAGLQNRRQKILWKGGMVILLKKKRQKSAFLGRILFRGFCDPQERLVLGSNGRSTCMGMISNPW
jgi:hypothetical protein